jgi:hypothetical protein
VNFYVVLNLDSLLVHEEWPDFLVAEWILSCQQVSHKAFLILDATAHVEQNMGPEGVLIAFFKVKIGQTILGCKTKLVSVNCVTETAYFLRPTVFLLIILRNLIWIRKNIG